MAVAYESFMEAVPEEHKSFVSSLHELLTKQGCTVSIKEARSGYTVSYQVEKRAVMNWVFRKAGIFVRIYGDNVRQYEAEIAALPPNMKKNMTGARDCKRLIDPSACSDTCVQGLVYSIDENVYKKCRYDGMFFPLSDETGRHIQKLVTAEVAARQSA